MIGKEFAPYQHRFEERDGVVQIAFPEILPVYSVSTVQGEIIFERAKVFFDQMLGFIGYNARSRDVVSRTEQYNLNLVGGRPHEDQFITMLIVEDELVASVLARRNDNNYWQVASSHYLTPKILEKVRVAIKSNINNDEFSIPSQTPQS